jgi:GGDEF domain-containing protein
MLAALPPRRVFALLALAAFALVSLLFDVYDRRGLGLGHYYYVAVALAALAGGLRVGAGAGLLAVGLFQLGVIVNPHLTVTTTSAFGTLVRASTLVSIGALVGWFADGHRLMVSELRLLAEHDDLTGLPTTRAFERAINRRLGAGNQFILLVGELGQSDQSEQRADDLLQELGSRLRSSLDPADEIARVGTREFAILAGRGARDARTVAGQLERAAATPLARLSFGWASFPDDGENAISLYRAACERLHARRIVRELDGRQQRAAPGSRS